MKQIIKERIHLTKEIRRIFLPLQPSNIKYINRTFCCHRPVHQAETHQRKSTQGQAREIHPPLTWQHDEYKGII